MVMNKKELAPGIFIYSDVVENHTSLIADIEEGMISARRDWIPSSIKSNDTVKIDTEYRDTLTSVVPYSKSIIDDFINLDQAFNATLSNIFLVGFGPAELDYKSEHQLETIWHDSYSILKYGKGQKFVNHIDDHKDFHRRLSLVYYINDNYEGGEIVFPRFNITYKPNANELLLFPSTYVYNHSVLPVLEGTRYSVVSWLK
jgi:hypothetical protein